MVSCGLLWSPVVVFGLLRFQTYRDKAPFSLAETWSLLLDTDYYLVWLKLVIH